MDDPKPFDKNDPTTWFPDEDDDEAEGSSEEQSGGVGESGL